MGSPISPFFAELVMGDVGDHCINELKNKHNISVLRYVRYVDHLFSVYIKIMLPFYNKFSIAMIIEFNSHWKLNLLKALTF